MKINRAYKVELDPTNKQRTLLLKHAGATRFVYNWALARRIEYYKQTGKTLSWVAQSAELTVLKKTECPWLYEVSKCATQEAVHNVDNSFKNFFRNLKQGKKPGFPKFKSKRNGIGSFSLNGSDRIFVYKNLIQLTKLGKIRLKEHNYIPTEDVKILSAVCSEAAGHWFVSVSCEVEIKDPKETIGDSIGIDLGVKTLAVCSDGKQYENPKALRRNLKRLAKAQRIVARRKKGSKNRDKAKQKVAKLHLHIANIRKDSLHKATTSICMKTKSYRSRPATIVIEDLAVSNMVKNHKLARSISDVGMSEFRRQLEYKAKWYGIKLVVADRYYPSSKLCSSCGLINNALTLADREWTCACGAKHNRDLNAAINLRNYIAGSAGIYAYGDHVSLPSGSSGQRSRNQTQKLSQGGL